MAPESIADHGPQRRKTLDEIRREIDAEYAAFLRSNGIEPPGPVDFSEAAVAGDRQPAVAPDHRPVESVAGRRDARAARSRLGKGRASRLTGYLVAGAIGFVVGQAVLVAYVATRRDGYEAASPRTDRSVAAVPAPDVNPAPPFPEPSRSVRPNETPRSPEPPRPARSTQAPSSPQPSRLARSTEAPPSPEPSRLRPSSEAPSLAQPSRPARSNDGPSLPEPSRSTRSSDAPPSPEPSRLGRANEARSADTPVSPAVESAAPAAVSRTDARVADVPAERDAAPLELPPRRTEPRHVEPIRPVPLAPVQDWVEAQAAVRSALLQWLTATNRGDIDTQMIFYAPRLDAYYLKRNVPREAVLSEKRRVLGGADMVDMKITAPEISLGPDGRSAAARFRKAYVIAAHGHERRGEVLQELRWERRPDGWKIVSERDIEVLMREARP